MTDPTEDILTDIEKSQVTYGTFWQRFFALLVDAVVLAPFIVIDIMNKNTWKSYTVLITVLFISLAYKPFCEFKYGATLGKMALKLFVANKTFQKANLKEVLLRNIFDIAGRIFTIVITLMIFGLPEFQNTSSTAEYTVLSNSILSTYWYLLTFSLITIIDLIFLLTDKQRRSLHDRIGQTFVIANRPTLKPGLNA